MAARIRVWSAASAALGQATYPQAAGLVSTAPGMPCGSSMAANARAGQAAPAGGSSCAHSAASDQVASTAGETPSTRTADMCSRRSASRLRYSRQLSRFTLITAAAWASASGSPSRSSPRSRASARWSGNSVSRVLRYASTSRRLNPPTGATRGPDGGEFRGLWDEPGPARKTVSGSRVVMTTCPAWPAGQRFSRSARLTRSSRISAHGRLVCASQPVKRTAAASAGSV